MKSLRSLFICMCAVIMSAGMAEATATLALTPMGNGKYTVNLTNVVDALMIDFTIKYDNALASPEVQLVNGLADVGLFFNDRTPGELRVNIHTTKDTGTKFITVNGPVATLTFPRGSTAGTIQITDNTLATVTNVFDNIISVVESTGSGSTGAGTTGAGTTGAGTTGAGTTGAGTTGSGTTGAGTTGSGTTGAGTTSHFNVTINSNGNGTISCIPTSVTTDQKTVCTVAPNTGYKVLNISGCGGSFGNLNGTTYVSGAITGNCVVTANFTAAPSGQVSIMSPEAALVPVPLPSREATPAVVPAPETAPSPTPPTPSPAPAPVTEVPQQASAPPLVDKGLAPEKADSKPNIGWSDKFRTIPNVLDNFRTYKSIRKLSNYQPFFMDYLQNKAISQEPQIAISDGKSPTSLTIEMESSIVNPNFAMIGASVKSVRKKGAKTWQVSAVPEKGAYEVRVIISNGAKNIEVPLIVIPALDPVIMRRTKKLSEEGVQILLSREDPAAGKPAYDLNGDGLRNYKDDYILVAHYLRKKLEGSVKK